MTTIKNQVSEREEIEALLPWHAAGTLTRRSLTLYGGAGL